MNKNPRQTIPFSNSDISIFCGQLALILKSGISSLEGISVMLEDSTDEAEKAFLQIIYDHLLETGNLSDALTATGRFPKYMLQMTDIGEKTGTMDDVMEHLCTYYERESSISQSLRSAITYPMIMSGMMIVVIIVLLVKVMPIFNQVFIQLGTEMTGFSKTLMNIGNVLNRYSLVFIILLAFIVLFSFFATRTTPGKKLMRSLCYKLPVLRSVFENTAACRFAGGMALTLGSGLDTEQSLKLTGSLNEDPLFQKKLDVCYKELDEGQDLYDAIHTAGIFSGIYARMASIGAKTGTMDRVMERIASLYQEEVDKRINNFLTILEPTLVILLSLFVGIILMSVMLPLIGIMSGI